MILHEQAKEYWTIAKRFHDYRAVSKAIGPTAVRDMMRLQQTNHSPAVLKRISGFISVNRTQPPGNFPGGSGPRYA